MTISKRIQSVWNNKTQRQLVGSAVVLFLVFILIALSLFIFFNDSKGWFASNDQTGATGTGASSGEKELQVTLYSEGMQLIGDLSSGQDIPFDLDIPGSSTLFVIRIQNRSASFPVHINQVLFPAPTAAEEVPKTVTENAVTTSYYFSSQLAVRAERVDPAGALPTAAEAAAPFATGTDGVLLAPSLPAGDFILQNTVVTIAPGESEFIAVKVTFRNLDENQNAYINFGKDANGQNPAPCCKRHVVIFYH